jgi:protein NRD1
MTSCVAELDGLLQEMVALKPPGVSGPKIVSMTALCNANIQVQAHLYLPWTAIC